MLSERFDPDLAEVERYELRERRRYGFATDRREFVQTLGAGIMVLGVTRTSAAQRGRRRSSRNDEDLTERFHFGADGIVTVLTSKVEVGQGSRTQITQAAAEELQLPVERIQLIMADTGQCPDDGGTAGSRTTPSSVPRVRFAAALALELLRRHAAEQLEVDASQLQYAHGAFSTADGSELTLADLAAMPELSETLRSPPQAEGLQLRPVRQWQVLGTSVPKVGGRNVVTGRAQYPSDIVRPGMLYGAVLRPISYGATLTRVDLAPAEAMEQVTVVRDGDFIGCVAANSYLARQALEAIGETAEWQQPEHPSSDALVDHLIRTRRADSSDRDEAWEQQLAGGAAQFSQQYSVPYIQHAPMEPRAAVAEWEDDRLTVWTGTQQPSRVQSELSRVFRLDDAQVRVIVPDTGGGFGGKHSGEVAVEAARLARAAGQPVHVRWTREEEFTWAYFRPAGVMNVRAALSQQGQLIAWDFANINSGRSAIESPYDVNQRAEFLNADSPLRQGSYRALASTANTFARESAMDELATLAQADPLEFRQRHLGPGRLRSVLEAACERFDWQRSSGRREPNRGVGLACGTEKGSFVAACAEVEVSDGRIRVLRVCQAFECGAIQNPANLRAQVEGCLVMGLGGALTESIEFEDGVITNPRFSSYRVPRMADVPSLEIVLVDRPDLASVGAGETPIIAIAPAVANAIARAGGVRCRELPLKLT